MRLYFVAITIRDEVREILVGWSRMSTGEVRPAKRAGLTLELGEGASLAEAVGLAGMHWHSAATWRDPLNDAGPRRFRWTTSAESNVKKLNQCRKTYETLL